MNGRFLYFSDVLGVFIYEYTCAICGKKFRESSPDVSDPCLCDHCYHNSDENADDD